MFENLKEKNLHGYILLIPKKYIDATNYTLKDFNRVSLLPGEERQNKIYSLPKVSQ